jgi:hypothetical protein
MVGSVTNELLRIFYVFSWRWPDQQFSSMLLCPQSAYSNPESSFFPDPLWYYPLILNLCLPIHITVTGLWCITPSTSLALTFLTICPVHLILYVFTYILVITSTCSISKFISCSYSTTPIVIFYWAELLMIRGKKGRDSISSRCSWHQSHRDPFIAVTHHTSWHTSHTASILWASYKQRTWTKNLNLKYFEAFYTVHYCSQSLLFMPTNAHTTLNTYIYHLLHVSVFLLHHLQGDHCVTCS